MKTSVSKIYLALLLIFFNILLAQDNIGLEKSSSISSPNISCLGKFIESPVGYYTGIPQINIPLWNVKIKNVEVPIGLSYHSQGIKVGQIASNVGLGWSLKAGGVISRVVKGGAPDDYNKSKEIESQEEFIKVGRFWSDKDYEIQNLNLNTSDWEIYKQMVFIKRNYNNTPPFTNVAINSMTGRNDIEPDVFFYDFGNFSGKFVFSISSLGS